MTIGQIRYRLFEHRDIPGILRLWNDESDWGELTEKQFNDWYIDTPYGECIIVVAVSDDGRIVGQEVFTPTRILIDGVEMKANRISAPILARELRQNVISQANPTFGMFQIGINASKEKGFSILYAFPAVAWLPFMQVMAKRMGLGQNFASCEMDCYELDLLSLSNSDLEMSTDICVSLVARFDKDYDHLWTSAINDFPLGCAIKRSSEWLRWKLGGHKVIDVRRRRDGELIGYGAIREKDGLLLDAFAKNATDLEFVIIQIINALNIRSGLRQNIGSNVLTVMKTKQLAQVIEKLEFKLIEFKFAFCVSSESSISTRAIDLDSWYLMPND